MWRIGVALIAAGIGLTVWGVEEYRLASAAKAEPQVISCAALGQDGVGDNAHVVLTDFVVLDGDFVYESDERSGRWTKAWVPAVGRRADGTMTASGPADIRVIVFLPKVSGEADVGRLNSKDRIQGLVINAVRPLPKETVRLLKETYPGADFAKCSVLEVGRAPKGVGMVMLVLGGGIALLVGGGAVVAGGLFRRRSAAPPLAAEAPEAGAAGSPRSPQG